MAVEQVPNTKTFRNHNKLSYYNYYNKANKYFLLQKRIILQSVIKLLLLLLIFFDFFYSYYVLFKRIFCFFTRRISNCGLINNFVRNLLWSSFRYPPVPKAGTRVIRCVPLSLWVAFAIYSLRSTGRNWFSTTVGFPVCLYAMTNLWFVALACNCTRAVIRNVFPTVTSTWSPNPPSVTSEIPTGDEK